MAWELPWRNGLKMSDALTEEALTDASLDEAIQFIRSGNPFAQHTWGWDMGRFIDWRL